MGKNDDLRPRVKARMDRAREAIASKLYDVETVLRQVGDAADKGLGEMEIAPELALDLRWTNAAGKLTHMLNKHGLAVDWSMVEALPGSEKNPTGQVQPYSLLRISWEDPQ